MLTILQIYLFHTSLQSIPEVSNLYTRPNMKPSYFNSIFLIAAPLTTLAQNDGACVTSCETTDPVSSFCNGDETGAALDACTCQSFEAGASLINCIKACPADQVSAFAAGVPASCRGQLFPGVSVSTSGSAAPSTSASGSPAGSATTSRSSATGTTSSSASSTASQNAKASGSVAMRGAVLDSTVAVGLIGGVLALLMW
jgi:hypothetical protein